MLILGIESSCDENALAFVHNGKLQAEVVKTQTDIHALFGGVVPELASREHCRYIGPLYDQLQKKVAQKVQDSGNCEHTQYKKPDAIAVAREPGLLGSLLVGLSFAKALALSFNIPLIGVNHLHAHLLATGLEQEIIFPALGVLASGGHTHIYRMNDSNDFILLGRSIDDAAGEAFDKFGKAMGFPYPAGQHIDSLAKAGVINEKLFPTPYVDNDNLDFSFSGLKTAAKQHLESSGNFLQRCTPLIFSNEVPASGTDSWNADWQKLADMCASFNYTVAKTLGIKTRRALQRQEGIKSLILAGGVACNSAVREILKSVAQDSDLPFAVPSPSLCTDNAPMIAYAGYLLRQKGLRHTLSLAAIPRGQKVPEDYLTDC